MGSSLSIQTELNQNFLSTMLKTSEIEPMREIWKIVVVFHEKKSYCRTAASECWSSAKLGKNSSNQGSYLLLSGTNISWGLKPFRYNRKQPRIPKFVLLFNHQREILKISALEVQRFLSEYEVNKFLEMKVTLNNFWNTSSMKWIFLTCWWYILSVGRRYKTSQELRMLSRSLSLSTSVY